MNYTELYFEDKHVKKREKCIHLDRPLKNICLNCPRRVPNQTKWKAQCVHPKRPLNKLCVNCPKRIVKIFKPVIKCF